MMSQERTSSQTLSQCKNEVCLAQNKVTYQCVKNASYISKDSIRIIKTKDKSMLLIRTNNEVTTLGMTKTNSQMKQIRKFTLELSLYSKNKFQLMNKCDSFLLVTPLQEIKIHKKDIHQNWISEESIESHSKEISDIIINQNDDLIIYGNNCGIVKFWSKTLDWNMQQELSFTNEFKICLCLNKEGNKLIVFGEKYQIYFLQLQKNDLWEIKQLIKTSDYGQINFVTNDKFAYMSERSSLIQIFQYIEQINEFINKENYNLQLKKFYSCRLQLEYLEQLDALLVIKKNYFFFIMKNENGDLLIENLMQFQNDSVSFATIQNQNYIVTLEQVKKMKENDYSFVRKLQIMSLRKCSNWRQREL